MQPKSLQNNNLQSGKRILIVEDQRDLAEMIAFNLSRAGFQVVQAHDGRTAVAKALELRPDLILLDLMLPELSGTEVASRVRTSPAIAATPIIMLTAKADEIDQLVGLAVGADDYITKPFSIKVLQARIEALLRRSATAKPAADTLRLEGIEVNLGMHEASVDGKPVKLTLTEFRLLAALLAANGRVLSRSALMSKAIGPGVTVTERTIDVHITAVRKKLGEKGALVRTVRGVGYRMSAEPQPGDA